MGRCRRNVERIAKLMPKTITSPVSYFPGTVILSEPLTYPQVIAVEDSISEVRKLTSGKKADEISMAKIRYATLHGICSCVEKWELNGFGSLTPDTFPASPRVPADELIAWLQNEVVKLLTGADEIPNE